MIPSALVWRLGLSQLLCWGVTYNMIAVFAEPIRAETGWSLPLIYGGFSVAILVMGLTSPLVGRLVDERGGRPVMSVGSLGIGLGCTVVALQRDLVGYYAGWIVLGFAMRLTLYDAAFATLARIGGRGAKSAISQVTLIGGIASTVLWPVGNGLILALGWREALLCYGAIGASTLILHARIPTERHDAATIAGPPPPPPRAVTPSEKRLAGVLYASVIVLTNFLNSAMAAHMIGILTGLGLATATAVWVATTRGIGQSAGRLAEVLFGRATDPMALGVLSATITPLGFVLGLASGVWLPAAVAFGFLFGAGNGLATIVRGTQPLVLFDVASYGRITGKLASPSFFVSAAAPLVVAAVIARWGDAAALYLFLGVSALVQAASLGLWTAFRPPRGA